MSKDEKFFYIISMEKKYVLLEFYQYIYNISDINKIIFLCIVIVNLDNGSEQSENNTFQSINYKMNVFYSFI
jgi:hypothetical protein